MMYAISSEVIPFENGIGGIFIGNYNSVEIELRLLEKGIKSVLTVASGTGLKYSEKIQHKIIEAEDVPSFDLSYAFDEGADYIDKQRNLGNTIIVHCYAGISRSSSMIVAYLMKYKKMNFDDAITLIRKNRPIAHPNSGFTKQLKIYQEKLNIK